MLHFSPIRNAIDFWVNYTPPKTPRSKASLPTTHSPASDDRLSSIPQELKNLIIDFLDPCSATSLGLACPSFYQVPLKDRYPSPISLSQIAFVSRLPSAPDFRTTYNIYIIGDTIHNTTPRTEQIVLGELIQNWHGFARYRLHVEFPVLFLNKSVYGNLAGSDEEETLEKQYKIWELGKKREVSDGVTLELPNPRNKGKSWITEARQWIAASRHTFHRRGSFWDSWGVRGTLLDKRGLSTKLKTDFEVDMNDLWRMVLKGKDVGKDKVESDVETWSVASFEERKDALDPDRVWSARFPFASSGD